MQRSRSAPRKKGLNKGRNVGKIDGIFGGGSMFKLPGAVSTRCQNFPALEKTFPNLERHYGRANL